MQCDVLYGKKLSDSWLVNFLLYELSHLNVKGLIEKNLMNELVKVTHTPKSLQTNKKKDLSAFIQDRQGFCKYKFLLFSQICSHERKWHKKDSLCLRPHKKGQWALHVYSIANFVASWLKWLQMSLYVPKKSTEVIWIH